MFRALLILGLSLSSSFTFSQEFNYTFIELGYGQGDIEDLDGDGYQVGGSVAISNNFHLIANHTNQELDDFDVDATAQRLGVGFNTPLADSLDLVLGVSWVNSEIDAGVLGSSDDDGYGLSAGVRTWVADSLELNAGLDYIDLGGEDGDDVAVRAGLMYNLTSNVAIGLNGAWTDDPDSAIYALGVRFYFN